MVGLKQITRKGEMSEGQSGTDQTQKKDYGNEGRSFSREGAYQGRSETLLTPAGAILKQSVAKVVTVEERNWRKIRTFNVAVINSFFPARSPVHDASFAELGMT